MSLMFRWLLVGCLPLIVLIGVWGSSDTQLNPPHQEQGTFQKAGKDAALLVLPTGLIGKPNAQVGEVVAMLLERAGMTHLEITTKTFTPSANASLEQMAKELAVFVPSQMFAQDYVLYTDFQGTRAEGLTLVRTIVVTNKGVMVWKDEQKPGDKEFDRIKPREPLQGCLLVAQRLRSVLSLDDPTSSKAPPGKITQQWQTRTGLPSQAELDQMKKRTHALKQQAAQATITIYPVQAGDVQSTQSAQALVQMINEKKWLQAQASDQPLKLPFESSMNQQKVLWSLAHSLQKHVKQHPPQTDYVLFAHYLMGKDDVMGVHMIICNRAGDWVIVDFQNSHGADFRAVNPKNREQCDQLIIKRLQSIVQ